MENLEYDETVSRLDRDLLILHSPTDEIVSIENAGEIYSADHLFTAPAQAGHAAGIIAAKSERFV